VADVRFQLSRYSGSAQAAVQEPDVVGLALQDLDDGAVDTAGRVNQARVLVEYRVRIEEPESRDGKRTLPLDGELMAALTALRKRQLEESTIAGAAYRSGLAGLDWYRGGEYVITDAAGTPVHPERYSDEFGRLLRRAGLRRITLHDSRHTTLTLMEHAGVLSRSSASGPVTMTRRSRRKPTSTRARKTCNAARPRSPRFTRSLRTVRNCETAGRRTRTLGPGHPAE
jgi:integrase